MLALCFGFRCLPCRLGDEDSVGSEIDVKLRNTKEGER